MPDARRPAIRTGPKTGAGKAVSARNALRHGIFSRATVIPGLEDPADWQRHLDGMIDSLQPEGWHETVLVERIALLRWRSHRAVQLELLEIIASRARARHDLQVAEAYARATLAKGVLPDVSKEDVDAHTARRLLPEDPALFRIMRYETHLHRQYLQTLHELEAIQARRRGERPTLARLDISGPPVG